MFRARPSGIRSVAVVLLAVGLSGYASAATIMGSSAGDRLLGTSKADRLFGNRGNDLLFGRAGNDRLDGGRGDDRLYGERGNDRLTGGPGTDRLLGGPGKDLLFARDGRRDVVTCGAGVDRVVADALDSIARDCEIAPTQAQKHRLAVTTIGAGVVTSDPSGINCGSDCSEEFPSGAAVSLMAAPASGWTFAGWSGSCSGTGACEVFLDAPTSVRASFTAQPLPPPPPPPPPQPPPPPPVTFTLSVSVVGTGTVTSSPGGIDCGGDCSESYASGTVVTLSATPGGTVPLFVGWAGACTGTGGCSVTMNGDQSVIALFGP